MNLPIEISTPSRKKLGGQQTGVTDTGVVAELPGVIRVECRVHRTQTKNKGLAIALVELAVGDGHVPEKDPHEASFKKLQEEIKQLHHLCEQLKLQNKILGIKNEHTHQTEEKEPEVETPG